jgi:Na+/proline symporter
MKNLWIWVIGIAFGLLLLLLVAYGQSTREDYWIARKAADRPAVIVLVPSDQVLEWRLRHYYER